MTACTDEEIIDEYGVDCGANSGPDTQGNVSVPQTTGSVHRCVLSLYPKNNEEAFDKRSTYRVNVVIVDDINVAMDGFCVERGSAQLDITVRSESCAGNGTNRLLVINVCELQRDLKPWMLK